MSHVSSTGVPFLEPTGRPRGCLLDCEKSMRKSMALKMKVWETLKARGRWAGKAVDGDSGMRSWRLVQHHPLRLT
jgi:hypothetical protein